MEDIIFAVGAQLSAYNWQNYDKEDKNIWNILSDEENMDLLLKGESSDFINQNKCINLEEDGIRLYKEFDKRLILFYSEDIKNNKFLYKSFFEKFNLIEGTSHLKIYNESIVPVEKYKIDDRNMKVKENVNFSSAGITETETPFKAFAMQSGNDILISYSYLLEMNGLKNFNYWEVAEGVLCAIYFFDKINKQYPKANIYLTGEGLGGVLAEFVMTYEVRRIKRTVLWNGLLTDTGSNARYDYNKYLREKKLERRKISDIREDAYWIKEMNLNDLDDKKQNPYKDCQQVKIFHRYLDCNSKLKNLKNYYLYEEEIDNYMGEICFLIKKNKSKKQNEEELFVPENYVFNVNNFLFFLDDEGEIKEKLIERNHIFNFVKTLFLNEDKELIRIVKIEIEDTEDLEESYEIEKDIETVLKNLSKGNDEEMLNQCESVREIFIIPDILKDKYNEKKNNNQFYILKGEKDNEKYILGKYSNYESLGGIIGGKPLSLSAMEISNAKRAIVYKPDDGNSIIEDNGTFRNGIILLNGMQIGISAVFDKLEENKWEEYLGYLSIYYYYDKNGKDLIIEWEFLD